MNVNQPPRYDWVQGTTRLVLALLVATGTSGHLFSQELSENSLPTYDEELPRYSARLEYVTWWTSGNPLPPLVTTSPQGTPREQAGVIGTLGANVVYGNREIDVGARPGGRITFTDWLDEEQSTAIEGVFILAGDDAQSGMYRNESPGLPLVSRPFVNAVTGLHDAELVAYPSILAGRVTVAGFSEIYSGALFVRQNAGMGAEGRLDILGGYRFFRLNEATSIREELTSTNPGGLVPLGTTTDLSDYFATTNDFHGAELGLSLELVRDIYSFEFLTKLAIGNMRQATRINGRTVVTIPGLAPETTPGGLLALPTNMGTYVENNFAALTEFGFNTAVRLTPRLALTGGYTLILVSGVARSGSHLDTLVNTSQIGGGTLAGPAAPQYSAQQSLLWMQGLSLGLSYSW